MTINETTSFLYGEGALNVIIKTNMLPSGSYAVHVGIATPPIFTEGGHTLHSGSKTIYFMNDREKVDQIMAGMAHAAAEYFSSRNEPEPDWDAIAAEMDEDYHSEEALGD